VEIEFDAGSFKDPDGRVGYANDRVYRVLSDAAAERIHEMDKDGRLSRLLGSSHFVPTTLVDTKAEGLEPEKYGRILMRHERVPVVTYPYEWSFDMLKDAGVLTLEVLKECLQGGLILKDASAFNVMLFQGRMRFIDALSIERYSEGTPWTGYRQFCREFLYPLMLTSYWKIDFQSWLRANPTGLNVKEMARLVRPLDWFRKGIFSYVLLHAFLERSFEGSGAPVLSEFRRHGFPVEVLRKTVGKLERAVRSLRYTLAGSSEWIRYEEMKGYSASDDVKKGRFVEENLNRCSRRRLIDLGCNTGRFSLPMAGRFDHVIGLDSDAKCINALYRTVRESGIRNYVPVVADLLNPTPPLGWALRERKSLLERIEGGAFLALALVHHIAIGGNVPLDSFVDLLASLGEEGVVEWVGKDDPMVRFLLKNREDVFADYEWGRFREALERKFVIREVLELENASRKLCFVENRRGAGTAG
jgi:SAM-dependent methyltransferase